MFKIPEGLAQRCSVPNKARVVTRAQGYLECSMSHWSHCLDHNKLILVTIGDNANSEEGENPIPPLRLLLDMHL